MPLPQAPFCYCWNNLQSLLGWGVGHLYQGM